jgi:hypothetical protein
MTLVQTIFSTVSSGKTARLARYAEIAPTEIAGIDRPPIEYSTSCLRIASSFRDSIS